MSLPRLLVTLSLLSAGCAGTPPAAVAEEPVGNLVHGWVYDATLQPIEGAWVRVAGGQVAVQSAADGSFALRPSTSTVTLVAQAPGYVAASRTVVFDTPDQQRRIDFMLPHEADASPYVRVHQYDGFIECSAFAAAGHSHGGGGPPQGENPADCGTYQTTDATWDVLVEPGVSGLVVEIIWTPDTDLARNLLMIVYHVHDNGTAEYVAFNEGTSPLKVHVPSLDAAKRFAQGGTLRIAVEIGGGPDQDDVAFGAAIQQRFEGFTSMFWGQVPDALYSVGA